MFKSKDLETLAGSLTALVTSYCNNTLIHLTSFLNSFVCV